VLQIALVAMGMAATPAASGMTVDQSGPYVDVAAGLGAGGIPFQPGVGWLGGFGWWFGPYDPAYSFGRFVGIGTTVRQDWIGGQIGTAPMLEFRKGFDVIVAGGHFFLGAGPVLAPVPKAGLATGLTGRTGVGGRFRRTRYWSLTVRVEGGVNYLGGQVSPTAAFLLGGQFARPATEMEEL
jgi:hypothetical protein